MNQIILIPCSYLKRDFSNDHMFEENYFSNHISNTNSQRLNTLRKQANESMKNSPTCTNQLLPAFMRYNGNLYKKIRKNDWKKLFADNNLDVLIFSAFYGIEKWNEPILNYNLSMIDKIDSVRFETWWRRNGLSVFLADYITNTEITVVRSMLSGSYKRAIKDIQLYLGENIIWLDYKYTNLGSGSNYYRGEDVLRAIYSYEIQCLNRKCNSFATRRISKEEYECIECNQTYKISKFNIDKIGKEIKYKNEALKMMIHG